jgi:hypothetical protein
VTIGFPENPFQTDTRLDIILTDQGYRVIRDGTFCSDCPLLEEHSQHPGWARCKDSVTNTRGEWPAYFVNEDPVACARKEEA